jgi:hypothetical protein
MVGLHEPGGDFTFICAGHGFTLEDTMASEDAQDVSPGQSEEISSSPDSLTNQLQKFILGDEIT